MNLVSIVVPVFNEESVLPAFHDRLARVLASLPGLPEVEIVYVDDGSRDRSVEILTRLRRSDPAVAVVRLSRNFGKEAALAAGLSSAAGDCVIVLDADLQHPPESIPAMLLAWREGAQVVNMRRRSRADESWAKRTAARSFYRLLNRLSDVPIPQDVGDFRLYTRAAVDALNALPERCRFGKGLSAWIGFRQVTLEYDCAPRAGGESKWSFGQLWQLAIEGITSFSIAPVGVASHGGLARALTAPPAAAYFFVRSVLIGDPVPGFPTTIVVILLLGGLQLLAIGVLGEYLGRIALESKQRPLYLVERVLHARRAPAHGAQAPAREVVLEDESA
jgi:glycosyltransferase involved in cell wall biosynthesis